MTGNDGKKRRAAIEEEVRGRQKFTMAGAIGRAGGGMLKGASPVPRLEQAGREIGQFIQQSMRDPSGSLKSILKLRVTADEARLARHLENPLGALREVLEELLENEAALFEFVRRVDVKWGQTYQERPHFQQPGQPAHPDDEYTHESVKKDLRQLLDRVAEAGF